jgi:hypothetical protein
MPDSNDKGEGNYDIRVTVRGDWVRSSACSAIPQRSFPRLSSGSFAWNTRSRRSPHHVVPPWHQERWRPETGARRARPRLRSIPKSHRPGRSPPAWKPCPGREHKRGGRKRVWPKKQLVVTHRWLDQGRVPREIFAVLARWNGSKGARRQRWQAV